MEHFAHDVGQTIQYKNGNSVIQGVVLCCSNKDVTVRTYQGIVVDLPFEQYDIELVSEECLVPLPQLEKQADDESTVDNSEVKVRSVREGTKTQKALVIFKEMKSQGESRKLIIQKFKDVLDMSDAGAATYYANCSKKVNSDEFKERSN